MWSIELTSYLHLKLEITRRVIIEKKIVYIRRRLSGNCRSREFDTLIRIQRRTLQLNRKT